MDKFIYGIGTSALQIEEYPVNDWWGLKANDGSVLEENVKHLANWKTDYDLIAGLGVDAYRTSVDWARLQRTPFAPLEEKAVERYQQMFGYLKDKGIDVILTLHHFANPVWFSDKGGWTTKESQEVFQDYALKTVDAFQDFASHIITINEVSSYVSLAHLEGYAPPKGKNNIIDALKATKNMTDAHKKVYIALKKNFPDMPVGVSEVARPIVSRNDTLVERAVTKAMDTFVNQYVWNSLMMQNYGNEIFSDFIGMNYYGPAAMDFKKKKDRASFRPGKQHDDRWEVDPELMISMAEGLHERYNHLPVFIMENGTCTKDDSIREKFLVQHLDAIDDARKNGKNFIKGYIHWSLLNNFELNMGMSYQFGLVGVDLETMKRTPKGSYYTYRDEIQKRREII